jgi:hypothetical protein
MSETSRHFEHSAEKHISDLSCYMLAKSGTVNVQANVVQQKCHHYHHYHHYHPLGSSACFSYKCILHSEINKSECPNTTSEAYCLLHRYLFSQIYYVIFTITSAAATTVTNHGPVT